MKKKTSFVVKMILDEEFDRDVRKKIESSLEMSQKKWGVYLNTEDTDYVVKHSMNQLYLQMLSFVQGEWDEDGNLIFYIHNSSAKNNITIPDRGLLGAKTKLVHSRVGWSVDDEDRDDAIPIGQLYEKNMQAFMDMVEVAIFYAVASYSS